LSSTSTSTWFSRRCIYQFENLLLGGSVGAVFQNQNQSQKIAAFGSSYGVCMVMMGIGFLPRLAVVEI
jgi:hypothetical protein